MFCGDGVFFSPPKYSNDHMSDFSRNNIDRFYACNEYIYLYTYTKTDFDSVESIAETLVLHMYNTIDCEVD